MENRTPSAGENKWAAEREALHANAKQYQADHPGCDYLDALNAVTNKVRVASGLTMATDDQCAVLHRKAKQYQADYPGTDYFDAVQKVARRM